ncbi:Hypothetical protein FKW44_003959 [Caligus rogercresseyi]|uniref:Uncharacterized protein n=1 Tax=Caligus rogercresseyi TaxID=217165 RepID=A0A7T8HL19_CALRO|nr:Hypothetical protein FKW44_020787 [Caligus rogercresseyi]QQP51978.1 Hypothetical protein FKW44_003959 [Caligus rogercresseyi]
MSDWPGKHFNAFLENRDRYPVDTQGLSCLHPFDDPCDLSGPCKGEGERR